MHPAHAIPSASAPLRSHFGASRIASPGPAQLPGVRRGERRSELGANSRVETCIAGHVTDQTAASAVKCADDDGGVSRARRADDCSAIISPLKGDDGGMFIGGGEMG